jgi:hypothetical protein|tara:strand:+ start:327 stop:602 length:276 start_codon:yes stop_codon:yes gene_type:complete
MSEDATINELGDISAAAPEASGQPAAPAGEEKSLELTVNDLQLLRQSIEVATSRGAFKAAEMLTVGTVFNKLDTFLNAVAQQQKQGETNGS